MWGNMGAVSDRKQAADQGFEASGKGTPFRAGGSHWPGQPGMPQSVEPTIAKRQVADGALGKHIAQHAENLVGRVRLAQELSVMGHFC